MKSQRELNRIAINTAAALIESGDLEWLFGEELFFAEPGNDEYEERLDKAQINAVRRIRSLIRETT